MNPYVTAALIKKLREARGLTQAELAARLQVTDKAISKWETGRGYPDISLLEPLSRALEISVVELLSGNDVVNQNRSFNMKKLKFYVCPVCGNIFTSTGDGIICCCGLRLPPLEAEEEDNGHHALITRCEDEYFVKIPHEMSKEHFISFMAGLSDSGLTLVKLYPEGNAEARFPARRLDSFYFYCNRHGLFRFRVRMSPAR